MKKLVHILGISLMFCGALSAQNDYYWANGKKIALERKDKQFVLMDKSTAKSSLSSLKTSAGSEITEQGIEPRHTYLNKIDGVEYETHAYAVLKKSTKTSNLKKAPVSGVVYESPVFKDQDGADVIMTNFFYVGLNDKNDLDLLKKVATEHGATILGNNVTDESLYLLSCLGSDKNALELANIFHETGLFSYAEPEFLAPIKKSCYNDPMFAAQWNANNTGQNGLPVGPDINLCEAHSYAKGNGVIVAVFDDGVQYGHPDMPNVTATRQWADFSAEDGVNGSHGTRCAGIIGAQDDNGIGMVGVAPDCEIMPSAIIFDGIFATWPWGIATVVNFTWQNGADVISNSWESSWVTSTVTNAYRNAMNNGRGGLGTVVVFATGNDNLSRVSFPGRSDDRIITVGAMSPCAERKNPGSCDGETTWGSNFGTELDVVAPGVNIPTIDLNGGYISGFNGTSSATPHVAGVAALILSVNPNLTLEEVNDIIESTAQKVGSYNYQSTAGRANGSWNNEMGYGLVNAEAAVLAALPTPPLFTTYNVPRTSGVPTGFRQYSHVHTIGSGGPSLSNVFNSVFNWWGSQHNPNGLHQFTLETTNGQPRHYTNITSYGSYSLHGANPEISINSSIGFPGLEGDYWVNLDGSNLVLVEKSGAYALYFSNSSSAPQVKMSELSSSIPANVDIAPNPFSSSTVIRLSEDQIGSTIQVYNSVGVIVETIATTGQEVILGEGYPAGVYILHVQSPSGLTKQVVIKQ